MKRRRWRTVAQIIKGIQRRCRKRGIGKPVQSKGQPHRALAVKISAEVLNSPCITVTQHELAL